MLKSLDLFHTGGSREIEMGKFDTKSNTPKLSAIDLIIEIFSYLDHKVLIQTIPLISREFYSISNNEELWATHLLKLPSEFQMRTNFSVARRCKLFYQTKARVDYFLKIKDLKCSLLYSYNGKTRHFWVPAFPWKNALRERFLAAQFSLIQERASIIFVARIYGSGSDKGLINIRQVDILEALMKVGFGADTLVSGINNQGLIPAAFELIYLELTRRWSTRMHELSLLLDDTVDTTKLTYKGQNLTEFITATAENEANQCSGIFRKYKQRQIAERAQRLIELVQKKTKKPPSIDIR